MSGWPWGEMAARKVETIQNEIPREIFRAKIGEVSV
jgi:hypothetical protein